MIKRLIHAVVSVGAWSVATVALAGDYIPGGGTIFSASATMPASSPIGTAITMADLQGSFLLTQFCQDFGDFGPQLVASGFGTIAGGPGCTNYSPGILLRGGQTLLCSAAYAVGASAQHCLITGYRLPGR